MDYTEFVNQNMYKFKKAVFFLMFPNYSVPDSSYSKQNYKWSLIKDKKKKIAAAAVFVGLVEENEQSLKGLWLKMIWHML